MDITPKEHNKGKNKQVGFHKKKKKKKLKNLCIKYTPTKPINEMGENIYKSYI